MISNRENSVSIDGRAPSPKKQRRKPPLEPAAFIASVIPYSLGKAGKRYLAVSFFKVNCLEIQFSRPQNTRFALFTIPLRLGKIKIAYRFVNL
jgi:hypothetical protein